MGERRAPGEGQVNWNKALNAYVAVVITGRHPVTGRPTMKTRAAGIKGKTRAGERDAEQKLDELKAEIAAEAEAAEQAQDPQNFTLWDCIAAWHAWAPTTGKTSQWTADKLRRSCEIWLPEIAGTPLVDVDAALLAEHMRLIAPNLGRAGLSDVLTTVRRSIRHHMQQRNPLVTRNVADDVDLPVAGKCAGEPTFLTREQVEKCFAVSEGTREHALVKVGFLLGLRPGEIRALKWEHVDFGKGKTGFVYVEKWARRGGDGKTKTDSSYRGLPMGEAVRDALLAHRESWGDSEYLFTREDGTQLDKDGLKWRVIRVFKAAGLGIRDPYAMRHTFASLMVEQGAPRRKIADAMGHSNLTTFERIYRHKLRPEVDDDDLWGGSWNAA